jgi:hemerythrin
MPQRIPAELEVGFEQIDAQHHELLRRIEECVASMDVMPLDRLKATVAGLGDCFMRHFSEEERFMERTAYPDRGKHKSAHDLFMHDFAQLGRELEAVGLTPLVRHWIASRVPEWTRFHIQVNDVPLGRYLCARRYRPEAAAQDKPRVS